MMIRIRPESASTLATFTDATLDDNAWAAPAVPSGELRALAKQGLLFFIESEDPVAHRVDVFVDEPIPEDLDGLFTGRSGQFLLRVPTGRVVVATDGDRGDAVDPHAFDVPAGDYVVAVRDRAVPDVTAHERTVKQLVGSEDWRFCQRIDRLGAVGCIALAAALLLLLVPYVRRHLWFVPAVLALPFVANLALTRLPRYRRVKERQADYTSSLPVYLVTMHRVMATDGLSGGWYRG